MAWWKRGKSDASEPAAPTTQGLMPLIRLEGISKVFKSDDGAGGTDRRGIVLEPPVHELDWNSGAPS